jgi:hypothetical protein
MEIVAINKKNQTLVNRAVRSLISYNIYNDLRDLADNDGDTKLYVKYNRLCENTFDKFLGYCDELPKREVEQIKKKLY